MWHLKARGWQSFVVFRVNNVRGIRAQYKLRVICKWGSLSLFKIIRGKVYSVVEFLEVPFTSRPYEEKQEIKETRPDSVNIRT
jgi:hypothetical protein